VIRRVLLREYYVVWEGYACQDGIGKHKIEMDATKADSAISARLVPEGAYQKVIKLITMSGTARHVLKLEHVGSATRGSGGLAGWNNSYACLPNREQVGRLERIGQCKCMCAVES
jgi:hypothetical protein